VNPQDTDLERRVTELQAQIERLNVTLQEWRQSDRQSDDSLKPTEARIAKLTQDCAEMLDHWTLASLRHARVVGEMEVRLGEWNVRDLKEKIEAEWETFRQTMQQPLDLVQQHADHLRETSIAAASSALTGMERVEGRLAVIERDLSRQMGQLVREVRTAMDEMRSNRSAPGGQPWPLDSVARLHDELRGIPNEGNAAVMTRGPDRPASPPGTVVPLLPESAASLSERMGAVEGARIAETEGFREMVARADRMTRTWRATVAVLGVGVLVAAIFAFRWQRGVDASLTQAAAKVSAAERQAQATTDLAEKLRKAADAEIATARQAAQKAQIISEVLAAPDLVRYALVGGQAAPGASGQALWSRTRGLVVTASGIPEAPADSTYHLWLLTTGEPVSVAAAKPDSNGRLSIAADPPDVPRPVVAVTVRLEPEGSGLKPSSLVVLRRPPPPVEEGLPAAGQ
jgi:hypothetical protein